MKRQYGVIQGLILSLFSPSFYRDVGRNWGGIGFLYLILLFTLTWIPVLIKWQQGVSRFAQVEFAEVIKDFPEISVKGGKVSSPVAQPFEMKDNTGRVILVLDTTGKITDIEQTPADILLTETKLIQRDRPGGRVQIHDLRDFPDIDITREKLQSWLQTASNWLGIGLYPFVMVGSLVRALIVMLLVSVFCLIFRSSINPHADFTTLLRLAALGMTLSVYLDTGLTLAGIGVPFWFVIALVLTAGYVIFGLTASAPGDNDRDRPSIDDRNRDLPPLHRDSLDPPPSDAFRA